MSYVIIIANKPFATVLLYSVISKTHLKHKKSREILPFKWQNVKVNFTGYLGEFHLVFKRKPYCTLTMLESAGDLGRVLWGNGNAL